MLQMNATLDESYFVSNFISGLKEKLKHRIKVHPPKDLAEAFRQAKLFELTLDFENRRQKYNVKSFSTTWLPGNQRNASSNHNSKVANPTMNPKQSLIEYKRSHNLCFKCGEKYNPGHQCKLKQLNVMEEEESDEIEEQEEWNNLEERATEEEKQHDVGLEISMNALIGSVSFNTLRRAGSIRGRALSILVDSGSTHSFITPTWAKDGLELVSNPPLAINVANGKKLYINAKSNQLL
ncbi:hypothetical protein HRI_000147700 [Hibiscus trionum]|uniref:Uncharacterized protein n=1 Tax=Hibiscus trionum TaxID=183268 RepID=A0A9W7GTP0_HIBTR|nr:hypothetical protein HRI_000147700 [Hibiscus trionum]